MRRVVNQVYTSQYGHPYYKLSKDETWERSPRVNGKLILRSNPFSRFYYYNRKYVAYTRFGSSLMTTPLTPAIKDSEIGNLLSESYARFRGKLYKGSAALGVTLGSYKQSREMIVNRYNHLTADVDRKIYFLSKRKVSARDVASTHLEVTFGWVPLLNDIYSACTTVVQGADHFDKISARSSSSNTFSTWSRYGDASVLEEGTRNYRVTRSAIVRVVNRNRWLAERAGLLNPAAVAWDLVPWSFVVNMFVNTGQLVNSITDFAGLEFMNGSLTKSVDVVATRRLYAFADNTPFWKKGDAWGTLVYEGDRKIQTLDATSRPPLSFRVPKADWGLAAIAASLFTQKLSVLNRLVKPFIK